MPKPQTEDDKKHGDKLQPLIERASGKDGADDEPEDEVEVDDDEDTEEDDDDSDADDADESEDDDAKQ